MVHRVARSLSFFFLFLFPFPHLFRHSCKAPWRQDTLIQTLYLGPFGITLSSNLELPKFGSFMSHTYTNITHVWIGHVYQHNTIFCPKKNPHVWQEKLSHSLALYIQKKIVKALTHGRTERITLALYIRGDNGLIVNYENRACLTWRRHFVLVFCHLLANPIVLAELKPCLLSERCRGKWRNHMSNEQLT